MPSLAIWREPQSHQEFFPNAQLFGFTGTPIFEDNASYQQIEGQQASFKTTADIFQQQLHAYTITHAIEDRNVLRFHVDYYKPDGKNSPKPGEGWPSARLSRPFSPSTMPPAMGASSMQLLATSSINDAIEYHAAISRPYRLKNWAARLRLSGLEHCLRVLAARRRQQRRAAITGRPAAGKGRQPRSTPTEKKAALKAIIADYNAQYGSNHGIGEFDLYYQDVQKRIKDQQWPNADLPHAQKIDITIVVDMLLTGFDSKYLNTLYVDKNLKYHGLIQAFSRTNRVLNDTKPYGSILDFRQQQDAVDTAIGLFSGQASKPAKEIWLVDRPLWSSKSCKLPCRHWARSCNRKVWKNEPEAVVNLQGDAARAQFINLFKEVQRLNTQLDQYTDLTQTTRPAFSADLRPRISCRVSRVCTSIHGPTSEGKAETQAATRPIRQCSSSISSLCYLPAASSITTTSWR